MKKVVVVTGSSSGLGKAIATLLLQRGDYHLILTGRNARGLAEFQNNSDVDIIIGDITDNKTLDAIENNVKKRKRIDILINNAGIIYIQPYTDNTRQQLDDLLEIDLKAPMLLTQQLYPLMVKQQSGHIININSTTGLLAKANHTLYSAAKFGLKGFTDALRYEANQHNIRVTSFHPGGMKTEFYDELTGIPVEKYMNPRLIAKLLLQLIETDPSIAPDEIVINRMMK
ncbi:MAG TPA: SDR family oxidoreductase [Candidatus Sulfotelmatobacter sp.]|jgi:short-subunit dehydrogenase|nr:SDR family oxidoreductase [Candidatus Sulfotelmatobacter sp.]